MIGQSEELCKSLNSELSLLRLMRRKCPKEKRGGSNPVAAILFRLVNESLFQATITRGCKSSAKRRLPDSSRSLTFRPPPKRWRTEVAVAGGLVYADNR